jgi:DNA polymerase II small subunit/DNA polymerase delta subunit B
MGLEDKISQKDKELMEAIKSSNLSEEELKIILSQDHVPKKIKEYSFSGKGKIKFGIIGDTHIGSDKFDEGLFKASGDIFRKEGVKNVYHAGDILEGMSGRPGHIFELSQIGFSQQIKYAEKLFKENYKDLEIYAITGNHDDWFKSKNNAGINVGEELEKRLSNFHYLGENEAVVNINGVKVMLFHPNDGTAYATSYKIQKLAESFEGGKKPHILIEGHYHKALYAFIRNIHCFESGTLCSQTQFMRGKKISAHKGFFIVELEASKNGIESISPKFYPAYE